MLSVVILIVIVILGYRAALREKRMTNTSTELDRLAYWARCLSSTWNSSRLIITLQVK